MLQWLDGVAGPGYAAAILWTFAVLVLLLIILLIIRLVRSLTFGTFVAGGRNRKTRLAVMDATAVDSHRRLVLVRRDDIEHLLLIGGPTDVVVERDIRLSALRRPALTGDNGHQPAARSASTTAAPVRQAPPQPASVTATPCPSPPDGDDAGNNAGAGAETGIERHAVAKLWIRQRQCLAACAAAGKTGLPGKIRAAGTARVD
ncbi:hypothetical protein [Mesorhizobium sp. M0601]|uniref:hypothetical protein n=1 Tax=Mesorhizobium sp. M0601 TaxID=2956969 RepID=UPI0033355811